MALIILGLEKQVDIQGADTQAEGDSIRVQNPLGKIPTLVTEDGESWYDSRVIVEYLDAHAGGGKIIPKDSKTRLEALRMMALADGGSDASLLMIYEGRYRQPDKHEPKWVALQQGKVDRVLTALESNPPAITNPPHVGQLAVASLLGYQDFRFDGKWRAKYPKLVAWLDSFAAKVPAFEATKAPPQ
ncbi:glutathione S-transferase family protein [Variibacter gotjawalensis]|nr:glutathione S-transferase [Variibacter gotjawalensis]